MKLLILCLIVAIGVFCLVGWFADRATADLKDWFDETTGKL